MEAVIASLEAKRAELEAQLAKVVRALDAVRDLAGDPGPGAAAPAKRGPGGSRPKADAATWARAKAVAATDGAQAAATIAGVSPERIRQVAKKQGWPILKRKAGHQGAAKPVPAQVTPRRRCECGATTKTDPCDVCKQPWSRTNKPASA